MDITDGMLFFLSGSPVNVAENNAQKKSRPFRRPSQLKMINTIF